MNRRDARTVRERGQLVRYVLSRAKGGDVYICEPEKRRTNFYWTSVAKGDGPSESVMFVSEKVAALRADL